MRQPAQELLPSEPGRPKQPERAGRSTHIWSTAAVIALGSTASILSSTVVNVAIPDLEKSFHSSITDVQWVLTSYLLGLAAVIPVSGWLTDRVGARRLYLWTLVAFTIASGLCGAAWSLGSEIFFRVIQGLAGGMVMPVGMAMLTSLARPEERGRVMAVLGIPMMLGPAFGPTVGGWLIQVASWQWIFWVNLPAGLLAIVAGYFLLHSPPSGRPRPLDWIGLLMVTPGTALIIYGLTQATINGWGSVQALGPVLGGVTLLLVFGVYELRAAHPLLDLRAFRDAAFASSMVVNVTLASALFGAVFLIPVFMQQVQGYDTLKSGLLLAPQGVAAAAVMPLGGWLTDRFGARPSVLAGATVMTLATLLLTDVSPSTSPWTWSLILVLRGIGFGLAMMPNFAAAYVSLPPTEIARATAMANTLQRLAASLFIAVFATVLSARITAQVATVHSRHQLLNAAARGFDETFWLAAALAAFGIPAAMLLRRPLPPGRELVNLRAGGNVHPPLSRPIRIAAGGLWLAGGLFLVYSLTRVLSG